MILDINLLFPNSEHNHDVEEYKTDIFALIAKCRKRANSCRDDLREIFNDAPEAHRITFKECESLMYRAKCASQPKIPMSVSESCEMLPINYNLQGQCLIGKEAHEMHSSMFIQEQDFMDAGYTIHRRYGNTYSTMAWPRVIAK